MHNAFKPISVTQYPRNLSTNCLAFSLGITREVPTNSEDYNLDHHLPIQDAFTQFVLQAGFPKPRAIDNVSEAQKGEYIFMVFDFTPYPIQHPFIGQITLWDFHVVRREHDGTWVHKPGWKQDPRIVSDWAEIFAEFGNRYFLFALAPEKDD